MRPRHWYALCKLTQYVIGFWKTSQIVTLGPFHFIGSVNGYTYTLCIHSAITGLDWLVCFSRASFANPVNSRLRQWDPWRVLQRRYGSEIHSSDRETSLTPSQHVSAYGWHFLGHLASPNSPSRGFNLPAASYLPPPPTLPLLAYPYNMTSVILQWFWKKFLKIQQCKLASSNSYKMLPKRLFQL